MRKPALDLFFYLFPNVEKKFHDYYESRRLRYSLLQEVARGIDISCVYDIGANRGEWSKSVSRYLKGAHFYLFDASSSNQPYLSNTGFKYFIELLSSSTSELDFYELGGTGDSYYKEISGHYDQIQPVRRTSTTLDEVVKSNNLPLPHLIKIDTQGSELDILRGAQCSLEKCQLIYLECPIVEYNHGAPNFHDYVTYMKNMFYEPIDLCERHQINGRLIQVDLLFRRFP